MQILGIDPGLNHTGYGIISSDGPIIQHVIHGVISAPSNYSIPERLQIIFDNICNIVEKHRPEASAVEIVFLNSNPNSSLLLGHARGAVLCALSSGKLSIHEYTALQIKKAIVGTGKATKEQVQRMIRNLLSLDKLPGSDSADALACAICHANADSMLRKIEIRLSSQGIGKFKHGRLR